MRLDPFFFPGEILAGFHDGADIAIVVSEWKEGEFNFSQLAVLLPVIGSGHLKIYDKCGKLRKKLSEAELDEASKKAPRWKQYEDKHGSEQTTMHTTFDGNEVTVRLDKPPTDSTIIDFKDYDWSKSAYDTPFIQERVVENFQTQIGKYKTIRENVHFQFSRQPPQWVVKAINDVGGTYSVKP